MRLRAASALATCLLAIAPAATHASDVNLRIIDEGMNRSQVMINAHELLDGIGPRLTNSPAMDRAGDWAVAKLSAYGLSNVHRESFDFGLGWEILGSSVRMVSPRPLELTAIPVAWTPPTHGPLRAEIVVAPMSEAKHFAAYRGKLSGKIVLTSLPGEGNEPTNPVFTRFDSAGIAKLDVYAQPTFDPEANERLLKRREVALLIDDFLAREGAVARVKMAYRDGKLMSGEGYTHAIGQTPKLPTVEVGAEDYRRLARLARFGPAPVLEINSNVRFIDDDTQDSNIIADIPGRDARAGYVMAGAHLDSWVAGDGAADNGAGTLVVMEAARIVATLKIKPKRTIRFALWSGEEQGLFGSLNYVERHLAKRPFAVGQQGLRNKVKWRNAYPIATLPGYSELKAYFNMDNGSGKVRGIYAEGNVMAVPLLRDWLAPFAAMGAANVVAGPTVGTDHEFFQSVAIPAYQFIQDPLDYRSRIHHSNADTLDHLKSEDLRQAAVVLAGILVAAANSDSELPKMPLPTAPAETDPFKYDYPEPK